MERLVGIDDKDVLREQLGDADRARRELEDDLRRNVCDYELVCESERYGYCLHFNDIGWVKAAYLEGDQPLLQAAAGIR